jgi:hypothetical protein
MVESGTGKNAALLKRTPGIGIFTTLTGPDTNGNTAAGINLGPIRGMLAGEHRLFVVAGTCLYEVLSNGTFTNRSLLPGATTLLNDGKPAQLAANGTQLLVTSGGLTYCDNGLGTVQCFFNVAVGAVTTNGVNVALSSGDDFSDFVDVATGQVNPGAQITIGATTYTVATVTADSTGRYSIMTLTASAGILGPTTYSGFTLSGIGSLVLNYPVGGTATFNLEQGDAFDPSVTSVTIAGTPYAATYVGPNAITITYSGGAQYHVPYSADDPVTAGGCAFFDTYFIVFVPNSRQINISAIQDGTTWSGIDFAIKEGYPDNIAAIIVDHRQLWLFGDQDASEIWNDTGNAGFPFQRNASGFIQYACFAPNTPSRLNNGIAWIGGTVSRGAPIAWFASAFEPVRISNHAVETEWSSYTTYQDAIAFPYIEAGHHFWVIHFPTADKTWAYDATASGQAGIAIWHERTFSTGAYPANVSHRQLQSTHAYLAFQGAVNFLGGQTYPAHYVGDATANPPVIYNQGEVFLNDYGSPIVRIRTFPHLGTENLWTYFEGFELLASVKSGVINPWIDYSHDGGMTYVNPQQLTSFNAALPNPNLTRMRLRRMGRSRDRVFRETIVDLNADFAIVDAFYDAEAGVD